MKDMNSRLTYEVMHSCTKEIEAITTLGWVHDIPFTLVPPEIVAGFRGQRFTPNDFYFSDIWRESNHWNAAFVKDGKIIIFIYGTFNTLERDLYMARLGSMPSFQRRDSHLIHLVLDEVEKIAKSKKLEYIWTVTDRKGLDRKRDGRGNKRADKFILDNDKF